MKAVLVFEILKKINKLIYKMRTKNSKLLFSIIHYNIRSFHITAEVQVAKCSKHQSNKNMLNNANAPTLQLPTE